MITQTQSLAEQAAGLCLSQSDCIFKPTVGFLWTVLVAQFLNFFLTLFCTLDIFYENEAVAQLQLTHHMLKQRR